MEIIKKLDEYLDENISVALVTIVKSLGSSPRGVGSMMLVDEKGKLISGTIGGGKLEELVKEDVIKCITGNYSGSFEYILTDDDDAIGMACGGEDEVFIKVFSNREEVIIIGGGHICKELVYYLKPLDFDITIVDNRKEYSSRERFPNVKNLYTGDIVKVLSELSYNKSTSIVIMTHGHAYDEVALEAVINKEYRYLGMIGSKTKIKLCFDHLIKKGVDEELLKNIYAPIGLKLGGETPEEIGLSIASEIQSKKYNIECNSMKKSKGVYL